MQTLKQIYDFCLKGGQDLYFSSKDSGSPIDIQQEGNITFRNRESEGLMSVTLKACHTNLDRNGFNIDKAVMEKALPTFTNKPILGYIHEVNGQNEFYTHNAHIDENDDLVYDEVPVGVIPENNNVHFEESEDGADRECVVVNGYIYKEYSKAAEIIEREETLPVSIEMHVNEMTYKAEKKYLEITDFYFNGVTILGKDEEGNAVKPGMEGAQIKRTPEEIDKFFDKLKTYFAKVDEMSEFYKNNQSKGKEDEMSEENTKNKAKLSFAKADGNVEFELSLDEIPGGLCVLVNKTYGTEDKFYDVTAYADTVIMRDISTNTFSKQGYTVSEDGNIELTGTPEQVFVRYLTKEESDKLDEIVQQNSDLEQKNEELEQKAEELETKVTEYEKAEETAEKEEILSKEEYADYLDTEEFNEVKENIDNYTVDEFSKGCDLAFAKCVKRIGFAKNESKRVKFSVVKAKQSKGNSRYGSTFVKND